jgi:ribonuclease HII
MLTPKLDRKYLRTHNGTRIVGIDEAGRGAWAGPVAIGYFVYQPGDKIIKGVHDSKLVSKPRREQLHPELAKFQSGVVMRSQAEIDQHGLGKILNSTISQIVSELNSPTTVFIIDGNFVTDFGQNTHKLPKADCNFYAVAAASILAKVTRDRIMYDFAIEYPEYGFDSHVGYATRFHRQVIAELGVCSLHRRSFKPLQHIA